MSSLNSGFELDDEELEQPQTQTDRPQSQTEEPVETEPEDFAEVVFKSIDPGSTPELDDDVTLVACVNASKDLDYLQNDILKADGMSKTFALEAQKLIPGFISNERPLVFFTDFPSKTNYRAALEAIDNERKSIMQRIWEAIVSFMKRAKEWLKTLYTHLTSTRKKAETSARVYSQKIFKLTDLETVQKAINSPENAISKVRMILKGKQSEEYKDYMDALTENLAKFKKKTDSLYRRINKDDATYAVVSKSTVVETLMKFGNSSDFIVQQYAHVDGRWLRDLVIPKDDDGEIDERSINEAIKKIVAAAKSQGAANFKDHLQAIRLSLKQRVSEYDNSNMSLVDLFKTFASTFDSRDMLHLEDKIAGAVKRFEECSERIEDLQKTLYTFTNQTNWVERDVQRKNLNSASYVLRSLHEELHAVADMMHLVTKIYLSWLWVGQAMKEIIDDFRIRIKYKLASLEEADRNEVLKYFGIPAEQA